MHSSAPFLIAATQPHGGHHVQHFDLGWWIPLLAYLVSVTGSVIGLACTRRAASAVDSRKRRQWTALAAVSIGGVAIWLMHFLAMLGMSVPGSVNRYNLPWTMASAVLAIAATYAGIEVVGNRVRPARLLLGGVIMGLAVNLMHYVGMYALHIQGDIKYDTVLVLVSVAIGVTASTVALLFTLVLRSAMGRLIAGLIMGVAVVGMHYTGMAAMRVTLDLTSPTPAGFDVFTFLFPVFVLGLIGLVVPMTAVLLSPDGDDLGRISLADDLARLREGRAAEPELDDTDATDDGLDDQDGSSDLGGYEGSRRDRRTGSVRATA